MAGNEFAIPDDRLGRDLHVFSDVGVRRDDLEEWINGVTPESRHGPHDAAENHPPKPSDVTTVVAEKKCYKWLCDLMEAGPPEKGKLKPDYRAKAETKFKVGSKAFDRAWGNAVVDTGNKDWTKPGPRY